MILLPRTYPDIEINNEWKSVNALTAIPVGTRTVLLNKSAYPLRIATGAQPAADSTNGIVLSDPYGFYAELEIAATALEIWAKAANPSDVIDIAVSSE